MRYIDIDMDIYIYIYNIIYLSTVYVTVIEQCAVLIYNIVGQCYSLIISFERWKLVQPTAPRKEKSSYIYSFENFD